MKRLATILLNLLCGQTAAAQTCDAFAQFMLGKDAPTLNGRQATCSTSKVLGEGTSTDCYWVFDYRVEEAQRSFRNMVGDLSSCTDDGVRTEAKGVNHPDSFAQVTGRIGGQEVSLSLKDKGASGQTLIFLRAARP